MFISQRGLKAHNLISDLADGVLLINLLEIAFKSSLGRFSVVPKQLPQKIANVAQAFQFMESQGREASVEPEG